MVNEDVRFQHAAMAVQAVRHGRPAVNALLTALICGKTADSHAGTCFPQKVRYIGIKFFPQILVSVITG